MTTVDGNKKGKLLVLGGTGKKTNAVPYGLKLYSRNLHSLYSLSGFLGQTILKRAVVEGYQVTSVSRRGVLPDTPSTSTNIDYRKGDAREKDTIVNILNEGGYTGMLVLFCWCVCCQVTCQVLLYCTHSLTRMPYTRRHSLYWITIR